MLHAQYILLMALVMVAELAVAITVFVFRSKVCPLKHERSYVIKSSFANLKKFMILITFTCHKQIYVIFNVVIYEY